MNEITQTGAQSMTAQDALKVLAEVKADKGRMYKSMIRTAWMYCNYNNDCLGKWACELQNIRNQFGPSWLAKAKA